MEDLRRLPTSFREAKSKGSTRYFTGQPCKRGHVAERKTSNRDCIACHNALRSDYTGKTDGAKAKVSAKRYRERKGREWQANRIAEWRRANPDKRKAIASSRRARKLNQMPPDATLEAIAAIYADVPGIEDLLGEKCHVDHYVPLAAGGLHHEDNLRIVTERHNLTKGSKVPGVDWFPPAPVFEQVSVVRKIRPRPKPDCYAIC